MHTRMSLNQKGSTLIVVLIVLVFLGLTAIVISNFNIQTLKTVSKASAPKIARLMKQKLLNLVLTPASWQNIQTKNSEKFSTFNPSSPFLINIYQADGSTPYYKSENPVVGFDYLANPCSQFVSDMTLEGSDSCPFRYEILLKNKTQVNGSWVETIRFTLLYHPKSSDIIFNSNAPEFNFDIARNFNEQSVESTCISIGGIYENIKNECSKKISNPISNCGTGKVIKSQNNNANSNCDTAMVPTKSCTSGQVIKGFNSQGQPLCGSPL